MSTAMLFGEIRSVVLQCCDLTQSIKTGELYSYRIYDGVWLILVFTVKFNPTTLDF